MMKVKLIEHTPVPDFLAGRAAALCVGGDIYNVNACKKALRGALASGHESVAEHASFTFLVEGISRVTLAQLTRHRMASFSVESQRYCEGSGKGIIVPTSIAADPELARQYESLKAYADLFYDVCLEAGIPSEDARFGLLQAGTTKLVMTMNARELRHFFSLRCCNRAQWEIRDLAKRMLELVQPIAPVLFEGAGPGCARGKCPEKHPCGKPWRWDDENA